VLPTAHRVQRAEQRRAKRLHHDEDAEEEGAEARQPESAGNGGERLTLYGAGPPRLGWPRCREVGLIVATAVRVSSLRALPSRVLKDLGAKDFNRPRPMDNCGRQIVGAGLCSDVMLRRSAWSARLSLWGATLRHETVADLNG
jgi:hypothetical protein